MRHLFATLALVAALSTTSCAAWYQQFKDNPVAFVDDFTAKTNIIVADLTATFNDIVVNLPADKQAEARHRWQQGITALTAAEKALRAGVDAAVIAQQSQPNWAGLVADVVTAVQNIIKIVDVFRIGTDRNVSASQDPFVISYVATYGARK